MKISDIKKYIPHYFRKRFKKKYVVIESDDWGLERLISNDTLEWMKKKFGAENLTRWSYDSLETSEDLELIFDLLESYRGKFISPPVITANFITHNIDYKSPGKLSFIPLSKGFNDDSEDVRKHYKSGIDKGLMFPQIHGYSHYSLKTLNDFFHSDEGREAFEKKFLTAKSTVRSNLSFLQGEFSKKENGENRLNDASAEFEKVFGFKSKSIIPPTFIFDVAFAGKLSENEIRLVQSSNRLVSSDKERIHYPYFRERKKLFWSVRNCRLDPHPDYGFGSDQCLQTIGSAFANGYPAVIDFHRVNFAGRFSPDYREKTLNELRKLFDGIHSSWPDAEFIHTQKLAELLWQH